jgi:hypothetical protein
MADPSLGTPPCMGGWCPVRATCARYHDTDSPWRPAERLCRDDSFAAWKPIPTTPAHAFERHALALIHADLR